jgi:hypothetical protein
MPVIAKNPEQYKRILGVVTRAGERLQTIQVRVALQKWDNRIKKVRRLAPCVPIDRAIAQTTRHTELVMITSIVKSAKCNDCNVLTHPQHFSEPKYIRVCDPTQSTRAGDVITLRDGYHVAKHVRHVVTSIVTPFGSPVSARPPVPTEEERQSQLKAKRLAKDLRQAERGRPAAVKRVKEWKQTHEQEEFDKQRQEHMGEFLKTVIEEKTAEIPAVERQARREVTWVLGDPASPMSTTPFEALKTIALLRFQIARKEEMLRRILAKKPASESSTSSWDERRKDAADYIAKKSKELLELQLQFSGRKDVSPHKHLVPKAMDLMEEAVKKRMQTLEDRAKLGTPQKV